MVTDNTKPAVTFTADDARAYLDARATREVQRECSECGAVDPPTTVADALGGERVPVHDGCPARDGLVLPALHERGVELLVADECRAACEAVIALTAQLAATEAEARTALDALHARCDAAEAEAQRLRVARLDDAARHATECVRWGDRKVELLRRIVELEAALKAAQPALVLDAIRRGPAVMCCNPPPVDDAPPEPDVFEALDDIFESAAVDDAPDEPPQPNADRAQLAALAPKPPRVVFLHRPKELDPGEREAAARHFVMSESRLDVRAGDVVIARHFAWPWPRELFGDLRRVGARPVNDARGHAYAADLLAWTADLGDLCPAATDRFETLPERGPFVVKGEKADKGRWARMFAETKADAIRLRSELMADSGMRNATIVARRYVALAPLGAAPIPGACPPSVEYRVWVAFGRVLSAGYYWPPEDCDPALLAAAPKPEDIPAGFLAEAVARVSPRLDFFTLDVGVDSGGRWWVIEVSDGLRAGMSENDPAAVYAGLAAAIAAHYGDAAQLAALAGARFAEEHPAAAAGIVGACVAPKGEP